VCPPETHQRLSRVAEAPSESPTSRYEVSGGITEPEPLPRIQRRAQERRQHPAVRNRGQATATEKTGDFCLHPQNIPKWPEKAGQHPACPCLFRYPQPAS
jgi:hypothetical protein